MTTSPEITSESRLWAGLSYASTFLGLPLFLVPLLQRNDAYALFHAKHAAVTYILFFVLLFLYVGISTMTCGIGGICFFIPFLAYVPMFHGFVLVAGDRWEEPMGLVGGGERLFGSIKLAEK